MWNSEQYLNNDKLVEIARVNDDKDAKSIAGRAKAGSTPLFMNNASR